MPCRSGVGHGVTLSSDEIERRIIKSAREDILKDREWFWINAITKELCYRQRIIGVIHIEDGKIVNTKNPTKTEKEWT